MKTAVYAPPQCTYVYRGGFDFPPEDCDLDAVPGTERCSLHTEDAEWEEDEDTHDYYDED